MSINLTVTPAQLNQAHLARGHRLWSKEEDAILLAYFYVGLPGKTIAEVLGRKVTSIASRRTTLMLKDIHPSPEPLARLGGAEKVLAKLGRTMPEEMPEGQAPASSDVEKEEEKAISALRGRVPALLRSGLSKRGEIGRELGVKIADVEALMAPLVEAGEVEEAWLDNVLTYRLPDDAPWVGEKAGPRVPFEFRPLTDPHGQLPRVDAHGRAIGRR